MIYLTCTVISGVDLAHYGVSRAKDCGLCYMCHQVLGLPGIPHSSGFAKLTKQTQSLWDLYLVPCQ